MAKGVDVSINIHTLKDALWGAVVDARDTPDSPEEIVKYWMSLLIFEEENGWLVE